MARTSHFTEQQVEHARNIRDAARSATDLRKALSVILPAETDMSAKQSAHALGISKRTLFRYQAEIRNQDTRTKTSWGGRRNALLSSEEENEFLASWISKAEHGEVLTVPPIHRALMERVGKEFPISTTYRLLARHGWRKVEPDTRHPKSDPQAQADFKKNFLKGWLPPASKTPTDCLSG